jgi:hypothetical protein
MSTPEQKNALVLAVLKATTRPLGPTAIGDNIPGKAWNGDPWSPMSAAIVPVLRRIKAVRHPGGRYTAPVGS